MKLISECVCPTERPIKVAQFGEGNFLRAFADWMIDIANEKGIYDGNIAIIKPTSRGNLDRFERQNNLYTVYLRGKKNGSVYNESRIIRSVSESINCYTNYPAFAALAALPTLRVVISNTTEAGIFFDPSDRFDRKPPESYPGKLTQFLFLRYQAFAGDPTKGLVILPVELLEDNGKILKDCVFKLAALWKLDSKFLDWLNQSCVFCSTLVDRIVTGYPKEEAAEICSQLGYSDELLDVAEPFALWIIEGEKKVERVFPLDKAGLPVLFTHDQRPYRERKVRILNGAHTSTALAAYLMGKETVGECMADPLISQYMKTIVEREIIPTLKLPKQKVLPFARDVFERFENPFIKHKLLSITINSVSKWKSRLLPTFEDSVAANGVPPKLIVFSFAALLAFYSSHEKRENLLFGKRNGEFYEIHDNANILDFFAKNSFKPVNEYVNATMRNVAFWGKDLTQFHHFESMVCDDLTEMRARGMKAAMTDVLKK